MHLRKNYTKNVDLKQRRKGGGFEDLLVSIKFWIIKHQLIFTVYFAHQIGIIISLTISKLDRFSAEQKVLVILFCLRKLENETNLMPQSVKLLYIQYFAKALLDLSNRLQIAFLEPIMFLVYSYWHVFVLVSAISKNINLNIIFKMHCTHCALVPLKQKTPITILHSLKIFLINGMSFWKWYYLRDSKNEW